jgi:uncharacterized membrane protein (DUF4010 family)
VLEKLLSVVPPDALKMALVLALALFVGLEREGHKQRDVTYAFGGVTTFPIIGLVSYSLALVSGPGLTPWLVGLAAVSGFMLLSYRHKLEGASPAGVVTEMSALATYVLAALVQREYFWIATTVGVLTVLILELKKTLDGLTRLVASSEIVTVAKFLVLAAVILPIVPDRPLTRFHIDPFSTWLVVVAVSGVSFGSYVLQRLLKDRGGVLLSAVLGGAYSSTVTTVALAREAKGKSRPDRFAGAILAASAVMYVRLVLLIAFFDPALAALLAPPFAALAAVGGLVGWLVYRRHEAETKPEPVREAKNPLELRAAFLFAAIFVGILVVTQLVREHMGRAGLLSLAAIMGVTDVDPFILGLAQNGSGTISHATAAAAITIAAASNNVIKAFYAFAFADRPTGRLCLLLLGGLAALGLVPLIWE